MTGVRAFSVLKGCSEDCGEVVVIEHQRAVYTKATRRIAAPPIFIVTCSALATAIELLLSLRA